MEANNNQPSPSRSTITPEQAAILSLDQLLTYSERLETLSKSLERNSRIAESPKAFISEVLKMDTPKHIKAWLNLLKNHSMLVVEAARDHGKSRLFSCSWPLYQLYRAKDPVNIALVSYSEDQSRKNLSYIRKQIGDRPGDGLAELQSLQPKSKAYVWDSGLLNMSNDSTVEAFGFGSSVRGGHYHYIIVDDPTKDAYTMPIDEQENFFYGVLIPALRRGGQLVVTGNPVAKQDLMDRLEQNPEFKTFKFPAIDEKGKPLWPERYPIDWIDTKRRSMPAHFFAREYLLKRLNPADSKFKEEWIQYYDPKDINPISMYRVMSIDPAISPGGDALAAVVTATDKNGNTYVLERFAHRGDFKTGIELLCDLMERQVPHRIGFEVFAFQKMYKIWLQERMKERKLNFSIEELGKNTMKTKAMRIEALQPKLANRKLFFLKEHRSLIDQLLLWDPISKNNDDDEIDALAWQVQMWRKPMGEYLPEEKWKAGTMGEAIGEIGERNRGHYLTKLFEDLAHA
jgi:hypothetical protein